MHFIFLASLLMCKVEEALALGARRLVRTGDLETKKQA
jgi:hypothetical protein